jgi:aubergine-like protein
MLIGIDVCHATPFGSSVTGLVATMNATFSKYFSMVSFQPRGKEIIESLAEFVARAIKEYKQRNGNRTPRQVIVYRDGVGDGQLEYVRRDEVPQYRQGFDMADKLSTPRLTVVVVKKRIHTRIFSSAGPTLGNPPPGTVVDSKIMHAGWYDFFLVSQSVTQGTVTPTHYHVIEDQIGLRPQVLQSFTHQLTHLYYNWSGTIRAPAPCQYAHKLAFLVGQNIQKPPHAALSDKLFYL